MAAGKRVWGTADLKIMLGNTILTPNLGFVCRAPLSPTKFRTAVRDSGHPGATDAAPSSISPFWLSTSRLRSNFVAAESSRGGRSRPTAAAWSSSDNRWAIETVSRDTAEPVRFTCNFLWVCQGYYRHSEGYTPEWNGMDRFKGIIVHSQKWPVDLDYAGRS